MIKTIVGSNTCDQATLRHQMLSYTFFVFLRKSLKSGSKNHLVNLSILFTLFSNKFLERKMKIGRLITIIGIIIFIFGIIFYLQGESVVGPESSFMYANPEWISYGIQIAISGIIISGIGIVIKFINKG